MAPLAIFAIVALMFMAQSAPPKPPKNIGTKRKRLAEYEAAKNEYQEQSEVPVVVELKLDETFDSEVFASMFSGQINDVLASSYKARPSFPPLATLWEALTERLPFSTAPKNLEKFSHLLPHLAAVTAKKQGRRGVEKIQLVSQPSFEMRWLGQPDFGFRLVGPKHGKYDWILPGKELSNDDKLHSSRWLPKRDESTHFRPVVPAAVAEALKGPAKWAITNNNPWAFTYSDRELVVLRFYEVAPETRWLPNVREGEVRVGASYFSVPALPSVVGVGEPTAWEHQALFALPWYKDAPYLLRKRLSYQLGLWVALMARLCAPDEPVGVGPPLALNSWYSRSENERKLHEAHYSTALKKAPNVLEGDERRYSVVSARRKARYCRSQHDRECEAMAEFMNWRPDSPVGTKGDGERPRKRRKCRIIQVDGCAQVQHEDDQPRVVD